MPVHITIGTYSFDVYKLLFLRLSLLLLKPTHTKRYVTMATTVDSKPQFIYRVQSMKQTTFKNVNIICVFTVVCSLPPNYDPGDLPFLLTWVSKKNSSPPKPIKIVTQSLFARARKSIRIKSSYHMWLLHAHIWQYKLIKNHFSFTFRNLQINDNMCTGCTCNCLTMVRCEHSLRNTCTYLLVYRQQLRVAISFFFQFFLFFQIITSVVLFR